MMCMVSQPESNACALEWCMQEERNNKRSNCHVSTYIQANQFKDKQSQFKDKLFQNLISCVDWRHQAPPALGGEFSYVLKMS